MEYENEIEVVLLQLSKQKRRLLVLSALWILGFAALFISTSYEGTKEEAVVQYMQHTYGERITSAEIAHIVPTDKGDTYFVLLKTPNRDVFTQVSVGLTHSIFGWRGIDPNPLASADTSAYTISKKLWILPAEK